MERANGGYTIIEVMIVLAISGLLFISALVMFQGKQGETQFSQAMRDVDSKIQSYVNDVGVSLFPDAEKYGCKVIGSSSGRAVLTSLGGATQTTGTNEDCIFLGKTLQVVPDQSVLRAYTVLGSRSHIVGGQSVPVTTFDETDPEPAVDSTGSFIPELIDAYTISAEAAIVVSAHVSTTSDVPALGSEESDLVGFYNSLQSSSSQQGTQSLLIKSYTPFRSDATDPTTGVKDCIEQQAACANQVIKGWYICFKSASNRETAQLVVSATPAGITNKLNFIDCS